MGGGLSRWAGMKMMKTATLMEDMMATVPHYCVQKGVSRCHVCGRQRRPKGPGAAAGREARTRIQATVSWLSEMTAIRLMMICMRSWISKTQHVRMKKNSVMLGCSVPSRKR